MIEREQQPDSGVDEVAERITASLLKHVAAIAYESKAGAIFVYADALRDQPLPLPEDLQERVFYLTRTQREREVQEAMGRRCIRVPNVPLTRLGQIKVAVFLALARRLIRSGEVIVCLSGLAGSSSLDTVILMEVGDEFEIFAAGFEDQGLPHGLRPEVVERVLDLASELGNEGREGRPIGTMFVIGDTERVLSMSRQTILNPFHGYAEEQRNLLDPRLEETIKELASIDGAFIVRDDGIIETAGAYLKVGGLDTHDMPPGLGARHHAAAAITAVADAIAVTVSASTGTVMVFRNGRIITEIEKPYSAAPSREIRPFAPPSRPR